jgi:hypothetical protein
VFINKKHPKDIDLTYIEHLIFAWRDSLLLIVMVFVMFDVFPTYLKKSNKKIRSISGVILWDNLTEKLMLNLHHLKRGC